ncbi:hypothetical protein Z517_09258 [Fonsecaea pedrosoi CBS 271.37]|uniref:Uncharacterized protein n=1 Tax=Fonsecaea pedrosoi CBS 271.37 TaxID=1442368 RepID=A0A0D2GWS3_9EURO|nr:uncharacterized protein Z517_09258 [Fonsecaea pedrosoi CBS 271.37]KIW76814.1 hypothetical protein Z517_09258 [Fonsecaea pedrosoi CBS 271.37]
MAWNLPQNFDRGPYFLLPRQLLRRHLGADEKGDTWKTEAKSHLRALHEAIIAHHEDCYNQSQAQSGIFAMSSLDRNVVAAIVAAEKDEIPIAKVRFEMFAVSEGLKGCVRMWNALISDKPSEVTAHLNRLQNNLFSVRIRRVPKPWGTRRRYYAAAKGPPDDGAADTVWAPGDDPIDELLLSLGRNTYELGAREILRKKDAAVNFYCPAIMQPLPQPESDPKLWEKICAGFDQETRLNRLACLELWLQWHVSKETPGAEKAAVRMRALIWLEELSDVGKIKKCAKALVDMIDHPEVEFGGTESAARQLPFWRGIHFLAECLGPPWLEYLQGGSAIDWKSMFAAAQLTIMSLRGA